VCCARRNACAYADIRKELHQSVIPQVLPFETLKIFEGVHALRDP
jgi:hypothetical protein